MLPILGSKRGRSGERRSADVFGSYAGAPLTRLGGSTCSNTGSYPVETKHPHGISIHGIDVNVKKKVALESMYISQIHREQRLVV